MSEFGRKLSTLRNRSNRSRYNLARFSGLNGYPHVSVLFSTHFAGFKPWYFNRAKAMARYARHADFQLWFKMYLELVEKHPTLLEMGKLRNVKQNRHLA